MVPRLLIPLVLCPVSLFGLSSRSMDNLGGVLNGTKVSSNISYPARAGIVPLPRQRGVVARIRGTLPISYRRSELKGKTPRFQVRNNVKNPARNILRCNTQSRYGISQTGRFRPYGTVGAGPGVQRLFSANRERLSPNTLLSWGSASS